MRLVDADSQFTISAEDFAVNWHLQDSVEQLVRSGSLAFGHRLFGDQHDLFVILLRRLPRPIRIQLLEHLRQSCQNELGGLPDVILFPGESTAGHLVHDVAHHLSRATRIPTVMLTPAFRSYGDFSLKLEVSSVKAFRDREPLRVLLFDDSISSGGTEVRAIRAVGEMLADRSNTRHLKWLTYAALERGIRPAQEMPHREAPSHFPKEWVYRFAAFGRIGPETLNAATCPLCPGRARIDQAVDWSIGTRAPITDILRQTLHDLDYCSLEDVHAEHSIISGDLTGRLLYLCGQKMPDLCGYFLNQDCQLLTEPEAWLLFFAMHYRDIANYVGLHSFRDLVAAVIARVRDDDVKASRLLLTCIGLLPTSVLVKESAGWVCELLNANSPNCASALIAMALANQHAVLGSLPAGAARDNARAERHKELISRLRGDLERAEGKPDGRLPDLADLVEHDLNVLGAATKGDIVRLAWTVYNLFSEGRHDYFLRNKLTRAALPYLPSIDAEMSQALGSLARLAGYVDPPLVAEIEGTQTGLRTLAQAGKVEEYKELGMRAFEELWGNRVFKRFFHLSHDITDYARFAAREVMLQHFPRQPQLRWCQCFVVPPEVRFSYCFGPSSEQIRQHFKNAFLNAMLYYRRSPLALQPTLDTFRDEFSDLERVPASPLVIVFLARSKDQQDLEIVVANRGEPADAMRLFRGGGGLSNSRAHFSLYAGYVDYRYDSLGIPAKDLPQGDFGPRGPLFSSQQFTNLIVARLPIVAQAAL